MPRTKGSKNKTKISNDYASQIAEKQDTITSLTTEIAAITANIDTLKADLKEKKVALKKAEKEVVKLEAKKSAAEQKAAEEAKIADNSSRTNKGKAKTSMSFFTALSLSFRNLMTKKARTFLVSFAGSIGIIGIALILSLSSGFQNYIDRVQEDTLSSYPITIMKTTTDYSAILNDMSGKSDKEEYPGGSSIGVNDSFSGMMNAMASATVTNDLPMFKKYLEQNYDKEKITAIQYTYDIDFRTYGTSRTSNGEKVRLQSAMDAYMSIIGTFGH